MEVSSILTILFNIKNETSYVKNLTGIRVALKEVCDMQTVNVSTVSRWAIRFSERRT